MNGRRVFVSAASVEFAEHRAVLASWLRKRTEVRVQEDFADSGFGLLLKLDDEIRSCALVVHLVGFEQGVGFARAAEVDELLKRWRSEGIDLEATLPELTRPLGPGAGARSYTQWEAWIAIARGVPCLVYHAAGFPPDSDRGREAGAASQAAHYDQLRGRGKDRAPFSSATDLALRVVVSAFDLLPPAHPVVPQCLPFASMRHLFRGRERELIKLHEREVELPGRTSAIASRHDLIYGLGGQGKTRLAVEYAWRFAAEYSALLFVRGSTASELHSGIAHLADVLQVALSEPKEEERRRQIMRWLEADRERPWLLIVDNVDTEDARDELTRLLPALAKGHLVVTTQIADWSPGAWNLMPLGVLPEADAVDFLMARTEGRRASDAADRSNATELARELGCLALALEQAGAFIAETGISFRRYRERWAEVGSSLRHALRAGVSQYPRPVATAWHVTVGRLSQGARTLLEILAWLAPEPLPEVLFRGTFMRRALMGLGGLTDVDVDEAIGELRRYSLLQSVEGGPDAARGQMHRILQLVTREQQDELLAEFARVAAVMCVDQAFTDEDQPSDVRNWPMWLALRPHVEEVIRPPMSEVVEDETVRLMEGLGLFLRSRALISEAEPLLRAALAVVEARHDAGHPRLARHLVHLGLLLIDKGQWREAEDLLRRALAIDVAKYGAEHLRVAMTMHDLSGLLQSTNQLVEAESLARRALEIWDACGGPPDTRQVALLSSLAVLLKDTSRRPESEPLFRRALAIEEAHHGPWHPTVGRCLNNLGSLLQSTGKLMEARGCFRRALAINRNSYGLDHPQVAATLNNLATLLHVQGHTSRAIPVMQRAHRIDEHTFGSEHPTVASDLNNLASLMIHVDRRREAESLLRRAIEIDERRFDADHPHLARDLNNLAALLASTHRAEAAEPLSHRQLSILATAARKSGLEPAHLRDAMHNHAAVLRALGRSEPEVHSALRSICGDLLDKYPPFPPA